MDGWIGINICLSKSMSSSVAANVLKIMCMCEFESQLWYDHNFILYRNSYVQSGKNICNHLLILNNYFI